MAHHGGGGGGGAFHGGGGGHFGHGGGHFGHGGWGGRWLGGGWGGYGYDSLADYCDLYDDPAYCDPPLVLRRPRTVLVSGDPVGSLDPSDPVFRYASGQQVVGHMDPSDPVFRYASGQQVVGHMDPSDPVFRYASGQQVVGDDGPSFLDYNYGGSATPAEGEDFGVGAGGFLDYNYGRGPRGGGVGHMGPSDPIFRYASGQQVVSGDGAMLAGYAVPYATTVAGAALGYWKQGIAGALVGGGLGALVGGLAVLVAMAAPWASGRSSQA